MSCISSLSGISAGSFPMPYAMTVLAHQANDSNLRHAAKTFKTCNPIFLTQATEAERAEVLAQHKQWRMKKRLADMLQPPNAVLSHATMPAKLYRSLSQAKKRSGKVKRRSRVSASLAMLIIVCAICSSCALGAMVRKLMSQPDFKQKHQTFTYKV